MEEGNNEKKAGNKASPKKKKGRQKSTASKVLLYSAVVLVIMLVAGGIWVKSLWDQVYEVKDGQVEMDSEVQRESLPDIMTLLILGLDSRDPVKRADTIMLLSLNRRTNEINIISIPRDMRVEIPGYGLDKINHAYAFGSVSLTRQAVEDFLDIKVDYYITTDFEGFTNIVDLLGGIELEVEQRMRYYGIDVTIELDPGVQYLDGDKALQYVRFRRDSEGDLGRVRRQQKFLKALLQEMIAFRNILMFPKLMPELANNMKTDLELNRAITLANKLKSVDIEEINTLTLPGRVGSIGGISYVLPEEEEIEQLVDRYVRGIEKKDS